MECACARYVLPATEGAVRHGTMSCGESSGTPRAQLVSAAPRTGAQAGRPPVAPCAARRVQHCRHVLLLEAVGLGQADVGRARARGPRVVGVSGGEPGGPGQSLGGDERRRLGGEGRAGEREAEPVRPSPPHVPRSGSDGYAPSNGTGGNTSHCQIPLGMRPHRSVSPGLSRRERTAMK